MANKFYRYTKQRLSALKVFRPSVIEAVARFAETQKNGVAYPDFLKTMQAHTPNVHRLRRGGGVSVIDIPASKQPEQGVLVMHIAMGNSLDENQLFQLATMAGVNPHYRIIGFGNPSSDRYYVPEQRLNPIDLISVAATRRTRPLVAAELDYLAQQGIRQYYQIGYSFGALKAALEATYAPPQTVKGLLLIDPVSHPRFIIRLFQDFSRTYGPLGSYVNAVDLESYHAARGDAAKDRDFKKGLRRPINIANALLIARTNIFTTINTAIRRQAGVRLGFAWGTASELADDQTMQRAIGLLPPETKRQTFRLGGLEHAFANDIYLYAAIVRQFLDEG